MLMKIDHLLRLTDPIYMIPHPVPFSTEFDADGKRIVLKYDDVLALRKFLLVALKRGLANEDVEVQADENSVQFSYAGFTIKLKNSVGV